MTSPPVLPNASFEVKWNPESVTFGPLVAPVLIWEPKGNTIGLFARPNGMNLSIVFDSTTGRGTWTLAGVQGQAVGSVTVERF